MARTGGWSEAEHVRWEADAVEVGLAMGNAEQGNVVERGGAADAEIFHCVCAWGAPAGHCAG